jgi:DNA-binding CsgD family transcriptional regulator
MAGQSRAALRAPQPPSEYIGSKEVRLSDLFKLNVAEASIIRLMGRGMDTRDEMVGYLHMKVHTLGMYLNRLRHKDYVFQPKYGHWALTELGNDVYHVILTWESRRASINAKAKAAVRVDTASGIRPDDEGNRVRDGHQLNGGISTRNGLGT